MKTSKFILLFLLTYGMVTAQEGHVIYNEKSTIRIEGEKISKEVVDEISIPDSDYNSLQKYNMGSSQIPVSMADVIKLSDEYFKKTLGVPFTQDSGFIDIKFSWTGSLSEAMWFYRVTFEPFSSNKLPKSDHSEYKLAILMNGKIYPAITTVKEIKDETDPRAQSGIPYLVTQKRSEINVIEKELSRLYSLPVLKTNEKPGVYTDLRGEAVWIFYPDGVLFTIYGSRKEVYKVDGEGKVSTAHTFGEKDEKLSSFEYIGTIKDGTFVRDMGDTYEIFRKKE